MWDAWRPFRMEFRHVEWSLERVALGQTGIRSRPRSRLSNMEVNRGAVLYCTAPRSTSILDSRLHSVWGLDPSPVWPDATRSVHTYKSVSVIT